MFFGVGRVFLWSVFWDVFRCLCFDVLGVRFCDCGWFG